MVGRGTPAAIGGIESQTLFRECMEAPVPLRMTPAAHTKTLPGEQMPNNPRRWAKPQDVADYLGVSVRTVRNMIASGRIPAYSNGARILRIDLNEVDAAMTPTGGDAA